MSRFASRLSAAFGGGGGSGLPANFQRSPKASTLLREPLLRGSAQQVSVRMLRRGRSSAESANCGSFLRRSGKQLRQLPTEVWVVMLIDFLNSYRSFGFRSVQYQYMVNEFGLSDVETAYWLGVQSWLLVICGMLGAVLVDAYGVRRTALASLRRHALSGDHPCAHRRQQTSSSSRRSPTRAATRSSAPSHTITRCRPTGTAASPTPAR